MPPVTLYFIYLLSTLFPPSGLLKHLNTRGSIIYRVNTTQMFDELVNSVNHENPEKMRQQIQYVQITDVKVELPLFFHFFMDLVGCKLFIRKSPV